MDYILAAITAHFIYRLYLAAHGSHVDYPDCMGLTPLTILKTHPAKLNVMKVGFLYYSSLASLCNVFSLLSRAFLWSAAGTGFKS